MFRNQLLVLAMCVYSMSNFAAVVHDESVDGDLPGEEDALGTNDYTLLSFGLGKNSVLGNTPWLYKSDDPSDGFRFIVEGSERATIQVADQFLDVAPGDAIQWVWTMWLTDGSANGSQVAFHTSKSAPHLPDPVTLLPVRFDEIVLGPGEYRISNNTRISDPLSPGTFDRSDTSLDYAFEVTIVPLPLSILCFIPGAIIACRTRRASCDGVPRNDHPSQVAFRSIGENTV